MENNSAEIFDFLRLIVGVLIGIYLGIQYEKGKHNNNTNGRKN
jgi:hypothetical protein